MRKTLNVLICEDVPIRLHISSQLKGVVVVVVVAFVLSRLL